MKIYPSLLAAPLLHLSETLSKLSSASIEGLHIDIMDGHFVPNLTFGPDLVKEVHKTYPQFHLDVHLMTTPADHFVDMFLLPGVKSLSFHAETSHHPDRLIKKIKDNGIEAGIALNPGTSVSTVKCLIPQCDFALIMTVNPGFGGQSFQKEPLSKISKMRELNPTIKIHIDGGVNKKTVSFCFDEKADILVVGSAFFQHDMYDQTVQELMEPCK